MRVFVTGAGGFVGRWLSEELRRAGHEPVSPSRRLDVTDAAATCEALAALKPDAVAHLAGVAFAPDATVDPQATFDVTVGGTINVLEAVRRLDNDSVGILITGSAEVYGTPPDEALPLSEAAPLSPRTPYALSKAAQEAVAISYAARYGLRVVVTRSFNHTGPGQRSDFVVPALAERIRSFRDGSADHIPVGNLDVRRDMSDVRDVARAYRLLLEAAAAGRLPSGGLVVNVCSGRSVAIHWILEELCRLAGVTPGLRVDPLLVRSVDAPEIRGDPSLIEELTGWRSTTPLSQTLRDVWASTNRPLTEVPG